MYFTKPGTNAGKMENFTPVFLFVFFFYVIFILFFYKNVGKLENFTTTAAATLSSVLSCVVSILYYIFIYLFSQRLVKSKKVKNILEVCQTAVRPSQLVELAENDPLPPK